MTRDLDCRGMKENIDVLRILRSSGAFLNAKVDVTPRAASPLFACPRNRHGSAS
ncbi:MAG: hypothetical protein FWD69_18830 [Polyangiaceae bacterium]|nr:hypothetical protein [Polyangiaceae bacterium]